MELNPHRITLNLPAYPGAKKPNPDAPAVLLDGEPIRGIRAVRLIAGERENKPVETVIALELEAQVDGQVSALIHTGEYAVTKEAEAKS